jgi:hypothetical protein
MFINTTEAIRRKIQARHRPHIGDGIGKGDNPGHVWLIVGIFTQIIAGDVQFCNHSVAFEAFGQSLGASISTEIVAAHRQHQ